MKTILCLLLFGFLFGDTLLQTPVAKNGPDARTNRLLFLSNIAENLLHQHWDDVELPCLQKTLDIMRNVQNHTVWATWVWDSMQSPTGWFVGSRNHLGNFDQCIHPPWVETHPELLTQYCVANIALTGERISLKEDPYTTTDLYVSSRKKNNLAFNKFTWGVCLPAICKPNSIKKIAATFLNNTHLGSTLSEATIYIDSCQTYNENTELSYGYYLTL
ncbi:jg2035 [Pararge aegeria aegeria]|uniref:Jg2035 protein n=1 Tax=Pararge aegeria aegeria TaxID=348720 RepID=A0A8S4R570_9NEOP|nr:jg2035 [Pararge aegeria aegeria]